MKGHFGWEYKGKHKNLTAAYRQLLLYREDLENPPLLVVCDLDRFEVHTNFTGTLKTVHAFDLTGFGRAQEPGHPAQGLHRSGRLETRPDGSGGHGTSGRTDRPIGGWDARPQHPAQRAAHFLMKLMFCMFAEDIELLPGKVFSRIMDTATKGGAKGLADPAPGHGSPNCFAGCSTRWPAAACLEPMKSCTSTAGCSPIRTSST